MGDIMGHITTGTLAKFATESSQEYSALKSISTIPSGLIAIHKPKTWSSAAVVAKIR